jgi:hypothetical protein
MKKKKLKAEVLPGHKEQAVEVPFDPAKEWGIAARALWRGRRGHVVNATVNGFSFASSIVPRQKRFYLLIDAEAAASARIFEGALVQIAIEPCAQ